MKNLYLPVSLTLLIGIGIGWLMKPSAPAVSAAAEVARVTKVERPNPTKPVSEAVRENKGRTKAAVRTMELGGGEEKSAKVQKIKDQMAAAMENSRKKKDDRQIAELVEKLGLNAAQEAKIRAFFEKRGKAVAAMFSGTGTPPDLKAMGNEGLDKLLAETLSADQQQSYAEFKTAERVKKVESQALKDLANLNGMIDLRPDQKDAVYDALYNAAAAKVDKMENSGLGGLGGLGGLVSMIGGDLANATVEISDISMANSGKASEDSGKPGGNGAITLEKIRAQQQGRIDSQVEQMAPVLDEKQLQDYREHLESKGSIFNSMIIAPSE